MNIEKDVSDVLVQGTTNLTTANTSSQVCVGTVATPKKGMQLRAGIDNGGLIHVGNTSCNGTVTNPLCGFPLEAGDQLFLPVEDPGVIYIFNATANDIVHWIIL